MAKAKPKLAGQPLADRVIVVPFETEGVSKGGIVIPDAAREQPQQGEVIAVGPGAYLPDGTRRPLDLIVGDTVLFGKFSGSSVALGELKCLVMREEEIIMRFPKGSDGVTTTKP